MSSFTLKFELLWKYNLITCLSVTFDRQWGHVCDLKITIKNIMQFIIYFKYFLKDIISIVGNCIC